MAVETCCNESVIVVMFQASALLHKMHTLQLTRKYVKSITPERKAQVGLYMFHYLLNNVLIVGLQNLYSSQSDCLRLLSR